MKTKGKVIIIISACLFAVGAVLTGLGMLLGGHPGLEVSSSGFHSVSKSIRPYELEKTKLPDFIKASFSLDYANIEVLTSEDSNYYLEYYLNGHDGEPSYDVKGNTLTLTQRENSIMIVNFGFSSVDAFTKEAYVKLYVPKDKTLDSLEIESESGEFVTSNLKVDSVDLNMDYGDCKIKDSDFNSLILTMESGDVDIKNTRAGDFQFYGEYGDLQLKEFSSDFASLDMESMEVLLDAAKLGDLEYTNEYGDFTLKLPDKLENYSFDVSVEYGEIDLPDEAPNGLRSDSDDSMEYYETTGKGNSTIKITSDSGDINIQKR